MLLIYNPNRVLLGELTAYQDLLWTERFGTPGSFELKIPPSDFNGELVAVGNFVKMAVDSDSYSTMLIERVRLTDETDTADLYTITGSSLERLLDRRVIYKPLNVNDYLESVFHTVMETTFLAPTDNKRKWTELRYLPPIHLANRVHMVRAQYTGDNVLSIFEEYARVYGVGFRLRMTDEGFTFQAYGSRDFSGRLPKQPRVEFSAEFGNLSQTEFSYGTENLRNFAFVAGEGEGESRTIAEIGYPDARGIARRELYVDARDLRAETQNNEGEAQPLTPGEYHAVLSARGKDKLAEYTANMTFTGQASSLGPFRYGDDYTVGDCVYLKDAYGHASSVRITEYTISKSATEWSAYPTFEQIR